MTSRPSILITNDDGVHAPGIKHLCSALREIADVTVIAPATEQSAVSLSITIRHPLRVEKVEWANGASAWSVNGTPADCIKLGLNLIMDSPPDLVVSGINRGTNAGRNMLYSGTVAGAIEGVMHDIPAIAFSCYDILNPAFAEAEKHIPKMIHYMLSHPFGKGTLLNVNFPPQNTGAIKGLKLARQGKEFITEDLHERLHPMEGHRYYWLGARLKECDEHEESDIAWLKQGYATAVPIHVAELTDHQELKQHKARFESIVNDFAGQNGSGIL